MQCRRAERLFPAYLDGTIDARLCRKIETHLDECAACQGSIERYRLLDRNMDIDRAAISKAVTSIEGMDNWDRIVRRISVSRDDRYFRIPKSFAVAAVLVLGIGIGLLVSRVHKPEGGENRIVLEIRNINHAYNASVQELIDLLGRYGREESNTGAILSAALVRNDKTFDELIELLRRYDVTPEQLESIARFYTLQYETLKDIGDGVRNSIIDG